MSEVKNVGKNVKTQKIVEAVSNGFIKVYSFCKAHPVLTLVATNVAVGAVSYVVGCGWNKHRELEIVNREYGAGYADGLAGKDWEPQFDHEVKCLKGGTCWNELSEESIGHKEVSILRGAECMNLDVGDAVVVRKMTDKLFRTDIFDGDYDAVNELQKKMEDVFETD